MIKYMILCWLIILSTGCKMKINKQQIDINHSIVLRMTGNRILLDANQTERQKNSNVITDYFIINETILIYSNGAYLWRFTSDDNKFSGQYEGMLPNEILIKITRFVKRSDKLQIIDGIVTYIYDLPQDSITKQDQTFSDLWKYLQDQNINKSK